MEASAILQRTGVGLETIKSKSIKLTQSERLILIVVDGVTPYGVLREKVWALSAERFHRALSTLLDKELIYEVLLPDEYQQPEELDSAVVDRFLQQDPLDPVTIISIDPEDHFGSDLIAEMGHVLPSPPSTSARESQASPSAAEPAAEDKEVPPIRFGDIENESPHASSLQTNSEPLNSADMILSEQKDEPRSGIQIDPVTAPVPNARHATQRPGHGAEAKAATYPASNPPENSRKLREPEAMKKRSDRHRPHPEKTASPAPHAHANKFRRAPAASASKKWSEDLLKLCSWTGFVGGLVILMVAILKYYGTAV